MNRTKCLTLVVSLALFLPFPTLKLCAQTDSGPRKDPAAAGGSFPGLSAAEVNMFTQAMQAFMEVDSVSGNIPGETGSGLGPTFNGNSCASCHAQPAVGGSSPGLTSPQNPVPNPQVALATLDGAINVVPSFITARRTGARSAVSHRAGGGGGRPLHHPRGAATLPAATLAQPNFAAQLASGDIIFRTPTPTLRPRSDREHARPRPAEQPGGQRVHQGVARHRRACSTPRATTARHPLRLEGAEQVADDLRRRGLQRRAGRLEREFHQRADGRRGLRLQRVAGGPHQQRGGRQRHAVRRLFRRGELRGSHAVLGRPDAGRRRRRRPPTDRPSSTWSAAPPATRRRSTTGPSPFAPLSNTTYSPYSDIALHHMGTPGRRRLPRRGRPRPVPHRAAVGRRPAPLLPARRAHRRHRPGHSRHTSAAARRPAAWSSDSVHSPQPRPRTC